MSIQWISARDTIHPDGPYTQSAVETATFILYKLSGEKYSGFNTVTESYNLETYSDMAKTHAAVIQGEMHNLPTGSSGFRNLRLRHSPVLSVESVEMFGRTLDPSEYTLRNNAYLVRANSLPWVLDMVNDVTVTYTFGQRPPSAGRRAAIRLANEFILADMGSEACALPERITSVSRQGVSYTVMDPQEFISNGKVGIYEVDLFLAAVNPHKAKKRPRIFSVDKPRGERIQ